MNKITTIIVVIVAIAAAYYFYGRGGTLAPSTTEPAAQSSSGETTPGSGISIKNFAFSPANYSVKKDVTIVWTNNDSVAHTITADDGSFDSGPLNPGQIYSQTFSEAGTIAYHCSMHPSMKGTITVTD